MKILRLFSNPNVLPTKSLAEKAELTSESGVFIKAMTEYLQSRIVSLERELSNVSALYDKPHADKYIAGLLTTRKELLSFYDSITRKEDINLD